MYDDVTLCHILLYSFISTRTAIHRARGQTVN